jgi:predicted DNA-binding protein (UPF0251 family)
MVRPRKCKMVYATPGATYFKPRAIPMTELEEVGLAMEEFEALRLIDFEGNKQMDAAKRMKVSQPTLNRLLNSARKKVAEALVEGKAIMIKGGDYSLRKR